MLPFRAQPQLARLPAGYAFRLEEPPTVAALNRLLLLGDDRPRTADLWQRVLERSAWWLAVENEAGALQGFLRATSDQALNANLWDLLSDPADPEREGVLAALVETALARLRRELGGCSISISAPPEALNALSRAGFVVDPGGIRAMGLQLG